MPVAKVGYQTFNSGVEASDYSSHDAGSISSRNVSEKRPKPHTLEIQSHGLSVIGAAVFIAGEMAGSGVLALPRAVVDCGWIGFILIVIFCLNAGYGGTCLGYCWEMIEERYPEHRERSRKPYAIIAHRAIGKWGSYLVSACIQFTLFGVGTVYLVLASQIIQKLFESFNLSYCLWLLLIASLLTPCMWFGTPKDFGLIGVGAVLTTAIACVCIFAQIMIDGWNNETPVIHRPHSLSDFFLSFGIILFAFGGASTFPTIQNDMKNKKDFPKSIIISFSAILVFYLPIAIGGYFVYGETTNPNISLSLSHTVLVLIANVCFASHLIMAFLISINPVCQELEEIFQTPHEFSTNRCILRTSLMLLMVIIGINVPAFSDIISLVGGSTVTLLTFVFPPWFYMRLADQISETSPSREIPFHIRIYLWELICIGVIGGSASTYGSLQKIFNDHSSSRVSCF